MDLVAAVVANEQSLELVEPGEGALDDPAVPTKPRTVPGTSPGDLGDDAAIAQLAPVLVVVVATVGAETIGAPAWASDLAAHRRYPVDQGDQLGDVMAVAARDRPRERDPGGVDEEVVLGAVSGSINRARARLGAPFFACTWLESATARDHSISPAARNSDSSCPCSRSHTPARCHSSRRR